MTLPYTIEQGAGDTVVFLLHGVGGGSNGWVQTLPFLANHGYRAVAWDAPGYGPSKLVAPYTMAEMARAFISLVKHINAKRSIVLGHSMGGMVAQVALAMDGHGLDGAILFSTSPAFGKPGGDWQQGFLQSRFKPLDAGAGMAGLAPGLVRGMVGPDATPEAIQTATQLMSGVPEATYRQALQAIVDFNQSDNLPHIKLPVLCLAGEFDATASPAVMQKMAERIPGAAYACVEGVGHIGNMERPDVFNAEVLRWLASHFPV
jgi:3-oxoadipate enol-lactonase